MTKYGWRDNSVTTKKLKVKGKMPVQYTILYAKATSTSAFLSGFDLATNGSAAVTSTSFSAQPGYPVKLRLQMGSSAFVSTDTIKVKGYNAKGQYVSELLACPQTLGSTVDTVNAYARIETLTPNATSDSNDISLGFSTTIGLPYPIASSGDILTYSVAGVCSTSYNKTGGLTINATYDTVVLPALSGGSTISILWNSEVQE